MNAPDLLPAFRGYTTSVRMHGRRLMVHIDQSALVKLGASAGDSANQLRVLDRHMPRFHALALQLGGRGARSEVTICADDVWWSAAEGSEESV
ncbi:MAG: hypothetical protein EOO27_37465 [Comamonadaceae bacterium]|nr:MAG: hypothetical protein EOO27_37465 [Comamonadaceae bacterium]